MADIFMIWFVAYLSSVAGAFITVLAMTMVRYREPHSIGRVGWMALILLSPPIGLLFFIWLGGRKISEEHERRELVEMPTPPGSQQEPCNSMERLLLKRNLCPPTTGNEVRLLGSTQAVRSTILESISSAEESIYVLTFIMDEKESSNEVIERLCEKARSGVQVRLLVDGFGSFLLPEDQLQRVRDAGGRAHRFKPFSKLSRLAYLNFRNHRKLVVVDGKHAILGGANIVQDQLAKRPNPDNWVDLSLSIKGPAASQLGSVFCSDWEFEADETLPPCTIDDISIASTDSASRLTVMPIGPDGPDEILDDFWLFAIHRAQHRIWICTPYFVPPPLAMRSLELACRRGIDVRILVPQHSDLRPVDYVRYDYLKDLIKLGGKVYRHPTRMVHAKVGIVDDLVALVGSANFDLRSFFLNYELSVVVHDQPTLSKISDWYERLQQECDTGITSRSRFRATVATLTRMFASEL